jgi:hypothetical protein
MSKVPNEIRVLTSADRDQVRELFHSQPMILKHPKDHPYVKWFETFIDLSLRPSPEQVLNQGARIIGAFSDGLLLSYLGQKEWDTFPFWTVMSLHVRRNYFNVLDMTANGLGKCLDLAAKIGEERDRFTFYWVTDADHWNVREKMWSRAALTMKRYIILTERVCLPGSTSPYPYETQMLGGRLWTRPIAIKSAHLKKGYRHQIFLDRGLLTEPFIDLQGTGY